DAETGCPPWPPRTGQHPDGDVVSEPHLAGAARQVGPREHPGHAATGAAAERPHPAGESERRGGAVAAHSARSAPQEPDLCELSPRDGPAGAGARELRRPWPVA